MKTNAYQFKRPTSQRKKILGNVARLNGILLCLVIIKSYSTTAFVGGILFLAYLSFLALSDSKKCFFVIIGTKLTFDALWDVQLDKTILSVNLLQLSLIPIALVFLSAFKFKFREGRWAIPYLLLYLALVALAMTLNDTGFDYQHLIRQAGILIGFALGLRFIREKEDLKTAILALLLSTILPVFATTTQFVLGYLDVPILYYTQEAVRGARQAGFYFDAATNGMASLIALVTSLYVLQTTEYKRLKILLSIFVCFCLVAVVLGATRSIMIIASIMLGIFLIKNLKQAVLLLPVIITLVILFQPYLESVVLKSRQEVKDKIVLESVMTESEYRGLFTGRVSIWQDIWEQVNSGSVLQQIFGQGVTSNAHSTYFFLLLQIGWFGLFYYLFFHLKLALSIYRLDISLHYKLLGYLVMLALLLMGISATVVGYTSFQWIGYFLLASLLNLSAKVNRPLASQFAANLRRY